MMSEHDYAQFEGKKVRATSGENVLVGVFSTASPYTGYVDVDDIGTTWIPLDGWKFELIRELPTRKGAVIQTENGDVWVRDGSLHLPWLDLETGGNGWCTADEIEGDFTVLFEGIDA